MATFSVARLRYSFVPLLAAFAFCVHLQAADDATNRFGFTGPEIFPIDQQISLLHSADLDGDGLNDLIIVNNLRSKINLLYNRTGKTNAVAKDKDIKKEL